MKFGGSIRTVILTALALSAFVLLYAKDNILSLILYSSTGAIGIFLILVGIIGIWELSFNDEIEQVKGENERLCRLALRDANEACKEAKRMGAEAIKHVTLFRKSLIAGGVLGLFIAIWCIYSVWNRYNLYSPDFTLARDRPSKLQ